MSRLKAFTIDSRLDSPRTAVETVGAVTGLLGAYSQHGYEEGYVRGQRDLLAELPLAAEQFLRRRPEAGAQAQRLIRAFARFLEQQVTGEADESGSDPHLVEGGLGI